MSDAGAFYAKAYTISGGGYVAAMDGRDPYNPTEEDEAEAEGALGEALMMAIPMRWVFKGGKWVYSGIRAYRLAKYSKRINSIRKSLKIGRGRNIAYTEGTIAGKRFSEIGISGKAVRNGTVGNPDPVNRFFQTFDVGGYSRALDSEIKLLESFARQYSNNTNIKGVLKIVSERQFCGSCSNVVGQFQKMFPNVSVRIINGVK